MTRRRCAGWRDRVRGSVPSHQSSHRRIAPEAVVSPAGDGVALHNRGIAAGVEVGEPTAKAEMFGSRAVPACLVLLK